MAASDPRWLLLGLACAACAGCSVLTVAAPRSNAASYDYVHCTRSVAAPVLDTVAALASATTTAILAPRRNSGASVALFGGIAIVYGASAGYGFVATARCGDAQDEAEARRRERGAAATRETSQ